MLTALYGADEEDAVALRRLIAGLVAHRRLREAAAGDPVALGPALADELLSRCAQEHERA
jgi:hypothetical protein